ncbi:uncharacterized protein LOC100903367 [Galendromus occidentalis]|uniref:Uncharacterized protein LOC100903367 n=1 Tax=Galendromus occidentalis TaxID=34638 RepID=A0AAJ7L4Z8_9ACAR|nr:uncharacterized protein LOC100903367 [Galendromus occidentalis]
MKLIRWMEQHIRGGRKKDKEDKEKGKQSKKNRKLQRGYDDAGSIVKLQENELQNSVREQTTSAVESLLGPLYSAREQTVTLVENGFKGNYHCNIGLEPASDRSAFVDSQLGEGEVYSEIPDTPPPPAPPSIANRIPLQHIRCIGQTAQSAVGDAASQAQHNAETPRERSRIKTNPWFVSSPQSPCCSSSTSGDSGAWTATSSDRSGRLTHSQEGQTPRDNASHDWYYADSASSTTSLTKKASAINASQLYQNVFPLEERIPSAQKASGGRVLYRYPSGTHISTAGNLNRCFQRRPESARTYRKSYFMNQYGGDTPDFTSSEDEAFSDDYQTESGNSDMPSVRKRSSHENRKISHSSAVCANDGRDIFGKTNDLRQLIPGRRSSQVQFPYTSGLPGKTGLTGCLRNPSPLKTPGMGDDWSRPQKTVERQMRQQENFLLHRELLQFKQFLLMRTLENMGSELNMNRNILLSSPQMRQRHFLRHHDLQGPPAQNISRQQVPTGHFVQANDTRLPLHQPPRGVPHQSPRLAPNMLHCSPLKDLRSRNPQMSPRTPRLSRTVAHQLDQTSQIPQLPQIPRLETGFDRIPGLSPNLSRSNNPRLLCSPKIGVRVNPAASPQIGRPIFAKPKGVPRTTTIDFQAFSSPSRKQAGETA